jgi:hypothetical protein
MLKKETRKMNDKDKSMTEPSEAVAEHPQLKRVWAFALFLARNLAGNHDKLLPDPSTIGPADFTRLTRDMSHEEKVKRLKASLERSGIEV